MLSSLLGCYDIVSRTGSKECLHSGDLIYDDMEASKQSTADREFHLDFPTKVAVVDELRTLTYAELELMTNSIANRLIDDGAKVGDRIGVFCEQGIDMVVAMYGIVAAGCAYVPIDPDFPEERISSMIEDTAVDKILTDKISDEKTSRLVACGLSLSHIYRIEDIVTFREDRGKPSLSRELTLDDVFCCIFTSGSTGRPKGIPIGHGSLRYQMKGFNDCLDISREDRILLSTAMVFDLSLPAIYGTILNAATMIIASREGISSLACSFRWILMLLPQPATHLQEW